MNKPRIRKSHGPEYGIQKEITQFLRTRGWWVERLVGFGWQYGLPDLLVSHPKWGMRFVEVKNQDSYSFTKAQKIKFPILAEYGIGIWVLVAATEEEYEKLFKEPNWRDYWKSSWGAIDVDALLNEITNDK